MEAGTHMTTISLNSPIVATNRAEVSGFTVKAVAVILMAVSLVLAVTGIAIFSPAIVIAAGIMTAGTGITLAWRGMLSELS
jgi:ABC-type phosphate transport system auxiliary subunit